MSFYPIRKTDVGMILTLLTLLGIIWAGYARTATWDQTARAVAEMRPKVDEHEKQLAVLISAVVDIKDDLRYLRRRAK